MSVHVSAAAGTGTQLEGAQASARRGRGSGKEHRPPRGDQSSTGRWPFCWDIAGVKPLDFWPQTHLWTVGLFRPL